MRYIFLPQLQYADNITLNSGTGGAVVKTDEIGGFHYQEVKIAVGADGTATPVSSTNPMPVSQRDAEVGVGSSLTSFRDLITATRYPWWWDSLADGLSNQWTQVAANGGTLTSSGGEGLFQTSASATGSIQAVSPTLDYIGGQVSWVFATMRLDAASAGNTRRVGAFTVNGSGVPQEGFYFEVSGTTVNLVYVKAGTATAVVSTSWSAFATAPFTLGLTYFGMEIRWAGNRADYYIGGELRHTITGGTSPLTGTLNLPATIQNINTSGATNRVLAVRNIGLGRFGEPPITSVRGPLTIATYMVATATFTPAASATDIFTISGSATKTVRILRMVFTGTQTTAGTVDTISVLKRSTANSGGTAVAATRVPTDSSFPAATAMVQHYTANPTTGTLVGTVWNPRMFMAAPATINIPVVLDFNFQDIVNGVGLVLRGAAESIALNFGGTTPAGSANFKVNIIWIEE